MNKTNFNKETWNIIKETDSDIDVFTHNDVNKALKHMGILKKL